MKVLLAGEGGQGVQVIAEILAKAAYYEGLKSIYIPNFGVEQRGGVSLAFVTIDKTPISYPKFEAADILVVFSDRSFKRVKQHLGPKTKLVLGPEVTRKPNKRAIKLDPGDLPMRSWNILVLGKINKMGEIVSQESLIKMMGERFARQYKKRPELEEINLKALKNEK